MFINALGAFLLYLFETESMGGEPGEFGTHEPVIIKQGGSGGVAPRDFLRKVKGF
ncbi:MAG: hypothetical protein ACJAS1_005381 [Oleiphilaceae bacterium]